MRDVGKRGGVEELPSTLATRNSKFVDYINFADCKTALSGVVERRRIGATVIIVDPFSRKSPLVPRIILSRDAPDITIKRRDP